MKELDEAIAALKRGHYSGALTILELAQVEASALEKENEALRQALEWYADEKNYNVNTVKKFFENGTIYTFVSEAENDKGTRARETLQSIRNEGKG